MFFDFIVNSHMYFLYQSKYSCYRLTKQEMAPINQYKVFSMVVDIVMNFQKKVTCAFYQNNTNYKWKQFQNVKLEEKTDVKSCLMYDDQDDLNADATGVEEQQHCIEGYDMHCPAATHIAHLDSAREQRRPLLRSFTQY